MSEKVKTIIFFGLIGLLLAGVGYYLFNWDSFQLRRFYRQRTPLDGEIEYLVMKNQAWTVVGAEGTSESCLVGTFYVLIEVTENGEHSDEREMLAASKIGSSKVDLTGLEGKVVKVWGDYYQGEPLLLSDAINENCQPHANEQMVIRIDKVEKAELIIDVRMPLDYNDWRIAGAVNLPLEEINNIEILAPDKEQKISVYCNVGRRSGEALLYLESLGYNNVIDLGGLNDIDQAIYPIDNL